MTAPPVCELDLGRMRVERRARLDDAMRDHGVDALLLLGGANVRYATGVSPPAADQARALHERDVAIAVRDEQWPHLFTRFPHGVPAEWPQERLHDHADLDRDEAARAVVRAVPPGAVAVDDLTVALRRALADAGRTVDDAALVLGAAKVCKTPDELECIWRAQAINEDAMVDVLELLEPGVRTSALTGCFLRRVHELGASQNVVEPVFQEMPRSVADGPFSVTGDPVYPTPPVDRPLDTGDVIWVDTGIDYEGLSSDFGRTWVVGGEPTDAQRDQFHRWKAVIDAVAGAIRPGATGADLTEVARAAAGGATPWLSYFYLVHGIGTASAEMPLIGTDLGPEVDASIVLEPGMVLVVEPVIWDDGECGYRSEDIFAVTDDGSRPLSDFPYTPFDEP